MAGAGAAEMVKGMEVVGRKKFPHPKLCPHPPILGEGLGVGAVTKLNDKKMLFGGTQA